MQTNPRAAAIAAINKCNFHEISVRNSRQICDILCDPMPIGEKIQVGDFIRYYSSMLDAFSVEQVIDISAAAITTYWVDGDQGPPDDRTTVYVGKCGQFWSADQDVWGKVGRPTGHSGKCYSLWRPRSMEEARAACSKLHQSEAFIPFIHHVASYDKKDVYRAHGAGEVQSESCRTSKSFWARIRARVAALFSD